MGKKLCNRVGGAVTPYSTGLPSPVAECAATSGEYPAEDMANKAVACPKALQAYPLTQLSDFAYNFTESHPDILAPTQSDKEAKPY
jgi:hypothetical protein